MPNNNSLRLAIATEIQRLRRTKLLPIYDADELREVVDAWTPIIEAAGIKSQWLPDLTVFALCRQQPSLRPFGAAEIAASWEEFIRRKRDAAHQDYYDALDGIDADDDIGRAHAKQTLEKRLAEM